jgi:hypothetical protein
MYALHQVHDMNATSVCQHISSPMPVNKFVLNFIQGVYWALICLLQRHFT